MCGILGIVGARASSLDARCLNTALDYVRHRGPDDEGYLLYKADTGAIVELGGDDTNPQLALPSIKAVSGRPFDVAFAHRRLSILDVSPAGHQPMASQDGRYWLTFNGEIYNFVELRRALTQLGHSFKTGTDTEVIIAAYAEWGPAMLSRFIGMFALGILDTRDRSVMLARDPFGIKPLYWTRVGNGLAFASEIKPLLSMLPQSPLVNVESLYRFMRFGFTDAYNTTMLADIQQLPAAHYMVLGADGGIRTPARAYWIPGAVPRRAIGIGEAAEELRRLFDESIRLHLRSDVPLGACLSGGLDSTAIVASMRAQLGEGSPIHSFSYINDDPQRGEGPFVDIAAKAFGLEQHRVSPRAEDLLADLDTLVRTQEQPFDTTSIYAQYTVFRLARQSGITVMLDGQGSDEIFGGYPTAVSARLASALLSGNLTAARALVSSAHMTGRALRMRITLSALGRMLPTPLMGPFMSLVGEPLYPAWMNTRWFRAQGHRAEPRQQGRGRDALREELLHFIQAHSLPRLLRYEDRNSMAFSIESRVPFCNVPLAEFALSLTANHLVDKDGETKAVLRRAMADVVPRAILERPKVGFETPERQWLSTIRPWIADVVKSDAFRTLPFISHVVVDDVIDRQLRNANGFHPLAWRFVNVAAWARQFNVRFEV